MSGKSKKENWCFRRFWEAETLVQCLLARAWRRRSRHISAVDQGMSSLPQFLAGNIEAFHFVVVEDPEVEEQVLLCAVAANPVEGTLVFEHRAVCFHEDRHCDQRVFAVVGFAYLQVGLADGWVAREMAADDGGYPFVENRGQFFGRSAGRLAVAPTHDDGEFACFTIESG